MNLAEWAEKQGIARVTAYRWYHAGKLPVPARKIGGLILVDEEKPEPTQGDGKTVVYARVSSSDQKADLDRQVARVTAWCGDQGWPVSNVVTEVGTKDSRRQSFRALLVDPSVMRIVAQNEDVLGDIGAMYVRAALSTTGRELITVDD